MLKKDLLHALICVFACKAAFPLTHFCQFVRSDFYLWRAPSFGNACVCLRRWTLSHRQRFQCSLLIQAWTRVHFFLCTNYSSFFSVGILYMPATHCHSKARCTFFSVRTYQLFLAATNFYCSCLSLNSWQPALIFRVKRHPQRSQYMHRLKRENFYIGNVVFVIMLTSLTF